MITAWLILTGVVLIGFGIWAQTGRRHPVEAMLFAIVGGYALSMGVSLTIALKALLRPSR